MPLDKTQLLPIAETFVSIHGEGTWSGTRMLFIRLAGCTVGKPQSIKQLNEPFPLLATGTQAVRCATYDGREFFCDTDFSRMSWSSINNLKELADSSSVKHICLTGGEPLMHLDKLIHLGFFDALSHYHIHIETSGTIPFPDLLHTANVWITVAPKWGFLEQSIWQCDELRILVDGNFYAEELPLSIRVHPNLFFCPINDLDALDMENVKLASNLLERFPAAKISIQMHKILGVR